MRALTLSGLALTLLAACGGNVDGKEFRDVGQEQSNFRVTPAAPLETPATLALPQPTPGGENRAEQ
ncbi:DUF3035 domain-containing protein [Yoonia sp.]|uniref:DUF3035 domain-containing protein n=1 Tax=Yoonia sp. TaxID=2212373 RepID=UPI0023B6CDEB